MPPRRAWSPTKPPRHAAENIPDMSSETRFGLGEHTEGALAYSLLWVSGLLLLIFEKKNKFIRFHALQSLIVFGALHLFLTLPILGLVFAPIIAPLILVLWVGLIFSAAHGKKPKVLWIGKMVYREIYEHNA